MAHTMKFVVLIFSVVVLAQLGESSYGAAAIYPQCICPQLWHPVCGSDEKTYSNECNFKCNKRDRPDLTIEYKGECKKNESEESYEDCSCTDSDEPVCGSDGITYSSQCDFSCRRKKGVSLTHNGECKEYEKNERCSCPIVHDPYCASDGQTYASMCLFECKQKQFPDLVIVHRGYCRRKICVCTEIMKPVCGSDGITYSNLCALECQKDRYNGLTLAHEGTC